MLEAKKIKKLEKISKFNASQTKKSSHLTKRCEIQSVFKPSIYTLPAAMYLTTSDLFLSVKDKQVLFDFSHLNNFKFVTSVGIRQDLEEKIVTVLLEPRTDIERLSITSMSNEFSKLGLHEWAQTLLGLNEKHRNFYETYRVLMNCLNLPQKVLLSQNVKDSMAKRVHYFSKYPSIEMRFRMKEGVLNIGELCMNETFIREAGFTLDNFPTIVLNEGIPQFFPEDSPALLNSVKSVMDNFLTGPFSLGEQETDFLMKAGYKKKIAFETHVLVEISEEDVMISLILAVTKKSLPTESYEKKEYTPEFLETLKEFDQEKEYLLNHYYNENFQGVYSNTNKVCKIKELDASF